MTREDVEKLIEISGRKAAMIAESGGAFSPENPVRIQVNLAGKDLSGLDLSGLDLRRANLHGANLEDADLSDTKLDEANLHGANLKGVTTTKKTCFDKANLHEADKTGLKGKATFKGANMYGVTE